MGEKHVKEGKAKNKAAKLKKLNDHATTDNGKDALTIRCVVLDRVCLLFVCLFVQAPARVETERKMDSKIVW